MIRWTTAIRRCDEIKIFTLDQKMLVEKYNKYFLDMLSELFCKISILRFLFVHPAYFFYLAGIINNLIFNAMQQSSFISSK